MASDRLSLLIETRTTGEAAVKLLEQSINRVMAAAEKSQKQPPAGAGVGQALEKVKRDAEITGESLKRALSNPLEAISEKFVGGASSLAKFAGAAAGITAAVAVTGAGLKTFVQSVSETALEIRSLSQSTGLTIGQADKLRAAANLTGFDIRNLKEASLDLSVALKDTGGQGEQTRQLLRQLGVQATTAAGDARPLGTVLLETFEALSKVEDVTKRVNLSRVLGGEDAAKNVQPLLVGFREANRVAEELGFGTRDNLLKALEDSNRELRKFDAQWEIIKGKVAEKIAPIALTFVARIVDAAGGDFKQGLFLPGVQGAAEYGQAFRQAAAAAQTGVEGGGILPNERLDVRGLLGRLLPAVPGGLADFSSGTALAARFISGSSGNEEGIKIRLDEIGKQRTELRQKLASGALAPATFKQLEGQLANLAAEEFRLQARVKQIEAARAGAELRIDSSTLVPINAGATVNVQRSPSLLRRGENPDAIGSGARSFFVADAAAIAAANPDTGIAQARAAGQSDADTRSRQLYLQTIRQELDFQVQKIELLTGPGGELQAINRIADLKQAALQNELDAGAEIFDLNTRRLQIEEERTLRILEIQRARREEARAISSDLVGSVQDGNIGGFLRGQGRRLVNQVGTNAVAPVVQRGLQALGGVGAASGLGRLLQGTILDPGNATPIDANTVATDRNTAAAERLTAVMGGGVAVAGGGGGGIGGMLSKLGLPSGIFRGSGSNPTIFSASGAAAPAYDVTDAGELIPITNAAGGSRMSGLSRGVGIAGALAGGAFGVVSGIRQGGLRGATTAVGSAAGSAAALLPLIGVSGPAAPILGGVALAAALLPGLIPDPRRKREEGIDRRLDSATYISPAAMNYAMTTQGEGFDYNRFGALRPIIVQQNISAMDAKGFIDRRSDIAEAARLAIQEAHSLNDEIRGMVAA